MITRVMRLLLLLQVVATAILFTVALKFWHLDNLWLAFALSIGSVFLFRLAITGITFMAAWSYRSPVPAGHGLDWIQSFHLFQEEFMASMLTTSWTMPLHKFATRTLCTSNNSTTCPVLLIHGFGCNSGYWHPFSKMLTHANIVHHAVDLEPVLGDIDSYVPNVQRAVATLCGDSGQSKIIIVAHSMGGLVARAYLRAHGYDQIAKVITLGTPHHGTGLANSGPGLNSRQMRRAGDKKNGMPSAWLQQLADSEGPSVRALFVSLYSHHDNIIAPQISSHLPGANNVEFHGIGHVALALNPRIQERMIAEIRLASLSIS